MKKRLVVEIDIHPGVDTVEKLAKWLDTMVPDLYAVRGYNISLEESES
jgi:hypothetical protein